MHRMQLSAPEITCLERAACTERKRLLNAQRKRKQRASESYAQKERERNAAARRLARSRPECRERERIKAREARQIARMDPTVRARHAERMRRLRERNQERRERQRRLSVATANRLREMGLNFGCTKREKNEDIICLLGKEGEDELKCNDIELDKELKGIHVLVSDPEFKGFELQSNANATRVQREQFEFKVRERHNNAIRMRERRNEIYRRILMKSRQAEALCERIGNDDGGVSLPDKRFLKHCSACLVDSEDYSALTFFTPCSARNYES